MLAILVVEDDPNVRESLCETLQAEGYSVTAANDGAAAIEETSTTVFDLIVSDIRLPKASGLDLLRHVRRLAMPTEVIMMTSFGSVPDAVSALKEGAADYLTKPFDPQELVIRVRAIDDRLRLAHDLAEARRQLATTPGVDIVGASPSVVRFLQRLATVAESEAPVLITGESGTGKELAARRLHRLSTRREGPFVAINCAAFPETLFEAELFGHERGAFTGANHRREGRFKAADGGVLFLDEIAEMPLAVQAKLLRVLQEGVIEPLGTNQRVPVDVRLVSATHADLKSRAAAGVFRQDLFFRVNVINLHLPALRERRADLPLLLAHFLRTFSGDKARTVSLEAWQALLAYPFPGNVREFAHAVEHAVVLSRGGDIGVEHLPDDIAKATRGHAGPAAVSPLATAVRDFERAQILNALAVTGGKRGVAANLLGISRKTLWEKLRGPSGREADD
jgi:DNA-binding NtrC family response regulator